MKIEIVMEGAELTNQLDKSCYEKQLNFVTYSLIQSLSLDISKILFSHFHWRINDIVVVDDIVKNIVDCLLLAVIFANEYDFWLLRLLRSKLNYERKCTVVSATRWAPDYSPNRMENKL